VGIGPSLISQTCRCSVLMVIGALARRSVATSLNNLAGLLGAKGDSAGAEPLYRRALTIDEKTLGPPHDLFGRTSRHCDAGPERRGVKQNEFSRRRGG